MRYENMFKILSLLVCMNIFCVSNLKSYDYGTFYNIIQDVLKVSTLEEAHVILSLYTNENQKEVMRSQLQIQLQLWTAEHGSYNQAYDKYFMAEMCRYYCWAVCIGTLSLPLLSKLGVHTSTKSMIWAAACGVMCAGIALILDNKNKDLRKNIRRYKRISNLLEFILKFKDFPIS